MICEMKKKKRKSQKNIFEKVKNLKTKKKSQSAVSPGARVGGRGGGRGGGGTVVVVNRVPCPIGPPVSPRTAALCSPTPGGSSRGEDRRERGSINIETGRILS